jgi:molybdopterin synthase sulfur carrier subunit
MPVIRIPVPLRKLTNNQEEIIVCNSPALKGCFSHLFDSYPEIKERILDDEGNIRKFINVFVNDEDVRFLQDLDTPINLDDIISIVPAIAGG